MLELLFVQIKMLLLYSEDLEKVPTLKKTTFFWFVSLTWESSGIF